jgi:hypothetical protein
MTGKVSAEGRAARRVRAARAWRRLDPSTPVLRVRDLPIFLILLPVVLAFLYVGAFGVDVPFGDTWTMVDRFEKLSQGTLTFRDLWVQHYEHRLLFPRIALLLLGVPTSFDNVAAMYLILAFFCVTLVVLLVAFRNNVTTNLLLFVPVAFLVFSLRQWFNMFSAIQIAFPLTQAFAALAFYLLYVSRRGDTARRLAFPAAMVSGTVSSYSLLVGLFVWPIGALQLLVMPLGRRTKLTMLGVWSLVGAAVWVAYFLGLEMASSERERQLYFFNNPSLGLDYFLTAFGNPFFWRPVPALALGAVIVCITAATVFLVYRAGRFGESSFWLALLAFGLLCLGSLTLGRAGGGLGSALQPRYITFTILAVIGVYAMLLKLWLERSSRTVPVLLGVLSVMIVVSVPLSYSYGLKKGRQVERQRERAVAALTMYRYQPDERLNILHRPPDFLREKSYTLCKLGYSLFSDPLRQAAGCLPPPISSLSPTGSSTTRAAVDGISGQRPAPDGGPVIVSGESGHVRVSGWAVDEGLQRPAGGGFIEVDGDLYPAFYGEKKPGVAERLGNPAYELSGFERSIPVGEIGRGEHELSLVVVKSGRKNYERPGKSVTFEVR